MKLKMMSLVLAAGLFFSCGTTYNATSDNAAYNVDVPLTIRSGFAVNYPDASNVVWNRYDAAIVPIDWEMTGWTALDTDDYAVSFDMGGSKYYAWYDSNGELVGTAYAVTDHTKLPGAVTTLLNNNYKGYTIDAIQREMWRSNTAYELKLSQGDKKIKLLVDSNGSVIKEKAND
jgi:hypothetical protein